MTHAGAYAACADTELVAVCDADAERAGACAERWGGARLHRPGRAAGRAGARSSSASRRRTPRTPSWSRRACARAFAGCWPRSRSRSAGEAPRWSRSRSERGAVLAVNYTRRFAPAFRALAAEAALGELQHVSGVYVKGLKHNGTHWLDLLRMLAGEPVEVRGWDRLGEGGEDPTLDAELTFATARARGSPVWTRTASPRSRWTCGHRRPRARRGGRPRARALGGRRRPPASGLPRAAAAPGHRRRAARRGAARRRGPGPLRSRRQRARLHRGRRGRARWTLADAIRASAGLLCTP